MFGKSISECVSEFEVSEANNNWKSGIVFGNSLTKSEANNIIKNMKLDAKGAYPNIEVKFALDKVKGGVDEYGIKVVAGYKDTYDKSEYSKFKKDLKSMLQHEIVSRNESLDEKLTTLKDASSAEKLLMDAEGSLYMAVDRSSDLGEDKYTSGLEGIYKLVRKAYDDLIKLNKKYNK